VISYAEFAPGKRYVAALRVGDSKRVYRVTSFEPNVAISDADLHPPNPRATWTFGEPRTVPITVVQHSPRYSNGGRAVHVDVSVNGHVGHFLLDSGAGSVLLFEPFARSAGLVNLGRSSYTGVNGKSVAATLARVDRMEIGGNTLRGVIVQRTSEDDATIAGIIGYDVLAGAVFEVDLAASKLTVSDPAGFDAQPKQGAYAFPVDLSAFHAGVPMKVAGNILPSVWLDTGDDFFVILPHELERKTVALSDTVKIGGFEYENTLYFGGVDGSGAEPARCVRLNEVQVGPYRYQKALSCFAPNDTFGLDGGLIGFDFLRHFNWTFDYPHGRVVLTPNGL
jgi:predicted aspartyl protease